MNKEEIGLFIKTKRKEKKLTQKQLAKQINVSEAAICKWEKGINLPDIQNLELLATFFEIPLAAFLNAASDPPLTDDCTPAQNGILADNKLLVNEMLPTDNFSAEHPPNAPPVPNTEPAAPLPSPKQTVLSKFFKPKRGYIKIASFLLMFFLLGIAVVIYQVRNNTNDAISFVVKDEYYDDYNGQKAYYVILGYTGNPTSEDIKQHKNALYRTYNNYFDECAVIIAAYFPNNTVPKNKNIEDYADYFAIFYPSTL